MYLIAFIETSSEVFGLWCSSEQAVTELNDPLPFVKSYLVDKICTQLGFLFHWTGALDYSEFEEYPCECNLFKWMYVKVKLVEASKSNSFIYIQRVTTKFNWISKIVSQFRKLVSMFSFLLGVSSKWIWQYKSIACAIQNNFSSRRIRVPRVG